MGGAQWATIDERQVQVGDWGRRKVATAAALAVCGDRLYVAMKTDSTNLLANSGESLQNLFKTGGGIDLMIGTNPSADPKRKSAAAGDVRLLVAQVKGKTMAVLYRPVAAGAKAEPVQFSSPLRTVTFDRVEDVSDQVIVAAWADKDDRGAVKLACYEMSVPLSVLGLMPQAGQTIRGDIGVLRGNGYQTLQRVYWSNKATGLVSDIPSEAELLPQLWGVWRWD